MIYNDYHEIGLEKNERILLLEVLSIAMTGKDLNKAQYDLSEEIVNCIKKTL